MFFRWVPSRETVRLRAQSPRRDAAADAPRYSECRRIGRRPAASRNAPMSDSIASCVSSGMSVRPHSKTPRHANPPCVHPHRPLHPSLHAHLQAARRTPQITPQESTRERRKAPVPSRRASLGCARQMSTGDVCVLYCFRYNPNVGTSTPVLQDIMRLGGTVTMVAAALFVTAGFVRRRNALTTSTPDKGVDRDGAAH